MVGSGDPVGLRRPRPARPWPGLLAATLLVAAACTGGDAETETSTPDDVGSAEVPSSGFFETSPSHFDAAVRDSGGLPTVVNVWASWCVPCRSEAPLLRDAAERYAGRVRFLGLNTKDTLDDAKDFVREFGLPYPNGFDPDGEVMEHLELLGLPATFFYHPDGELAFFHAGEIDREGLEEKVDALLASAKGAGGP